MGVEGQRYIIGWSCAINLVTREVAQDANEPFLSSYSSPLYSQGCSCSFSSSSPFHFLETSRFSPSVHVCNLKKVEKEKKKFYLIVVLLSYRITHTHT